MKSQKIKFVISFSFIICLMILLLVACQPDRQERNAVNFKVAFADGYDNSTLPFDPAFGNESNSPSENNVIAILKSKDNLVTLCKDNNFPFFNSDDENFDRKLSRVMRTYDNSYFEENGLLFILQNEADGNLPKIDNITAEQDILTVCFSNPLQTEKSAVFTLRNMYVFIVEMKKESLENVNNVAVEKTTKGTTAEYEGRNLYSEFYSLEYAYNRGLIAENDVRSIGYYHNSGKEWKGADTEQVKKWEDFVETDYQPMEKTPKELSETIIEKIRIS